MTLLQVFGILYVRVFFEKGDKCSLLAQLVEHYLDKVGVSSSSLLETTIYLFFDKMLTKNFAVFITTTTRF